MVNLCRAEYERTNGSVVTCHFPIQPHPRGTHSWASLQAEEEREKSEREVVRDTGMVLIDNIVAGQADQYLEAILAACHGRKRHLRGVPFAYGTTGGKT